jgi:asparagine synthase (glutamine-hydrolysing)
VCGIAAIFSYRADAPPVDLSELTRIREAMAARGPDGAGNWISKDRRVGLAHRRLAIIDTSEAAAQPMATADGSFRVSFNGEIYNYQELRRSLVMKGHVFLTKSDTEVLLHLYQEYGVELLTRLRGMYAFAIWDERKQALFLARDPLGIKPLYYADDGHTLRVASQVKALLAGGRVETAPEPAGHVGFFLWGHVPEPFTLYRGIRALPAGASMWVEKGGRPRIETTFSVTQLLNEAEARVAGADADALTNGRPGNDRLGQLVRDSVRAHLVSDVPVGVFLSAGMDSTTLAALIAETGGDLRTITLGFREYQGTPHDEVPLAEEVARRYGARHSTVWVTRKDFEEELPRVLAAMDQPSIDGVNTYFVAKAAASVGLKVAISGLGGDELFGGYNHFRDIPRLVGGLAWTRRAPWIGRAFRLVSAPILKRMTSPKYAGLLEYGGTFEGAYLLRRGLFMPWELPEVLDGVMVCEGWQTLESLAQLKATHTGIRGERLKVTALDLLWYMRNQLLRDADWASMAHSLELRTPFMDWHLLQRLAPLLVSSKAPGKSELARLPQKPLPTAVLSRQKTGFSVPVQEWLLAARGLCKRGLRQWARLVYKSAGNTRRTLALVGDGFGGRGGIAKFNRDFLGAVASHPDYSEIVAFPRLQFDPIGDVLPSKLRWDTSGLGGKLRYVRHVIQSLGRDRKYDLVVCGLINLLPLAWMTCAVTRAPLMLIVHGVDAWAPHRSRIVNRLLRKVDYVIAVSQITKERFAAWSGIPTEQIFVLPNCVDTKRFRPMARKPELVRRYNLQGRRVLMTLARLASSERYKGIDQILEVMPTLIAKFHDLTYLVVGDGDDRHRLMAKSKALGLDGCVIFAGHILEKEKVDHYNLADAFVMPGWGEGFGIVYLEAIACGVPTVGSLLDGSKDALKDGKLGVLVDPRNHDDLQRGIIQALAKRRGVPSELHDFSCERFKERMGQILNRVVSCSIREGQRL